MAESGGLDGFSNTPALLKQHFEQEISRANENCKCIHCLYIYSSGPLFLSLLTATVPQTYVLFTAVLGVVYSNLHLFTYFQWKSFVHLSSHMP